MIELIKEMFGNSFNQSDDKTNITAIEKAAMDAFTKQRDELEKKELLSLEDQEFKELVQYYKKLELEDDLLFMTYGSWGLIPLRIRKKIDLEYKPLYFSGMCISYSKLMNEIDELFKDLDRSYFSIHIYKYHTHYRLVVIDHRRRDIITSKMSAKDLREFYEYTDKNIVYSLSSKKSFSV
jgi:hypothetical protein